MMNQPRSSSDAGELPDPAFTDADVTFLVPVYNRIAHFRDYFRTGRWNDVRLQLICDGSSPELVSELERLVSGRDDVAVHAYRPNRGLARARAEGFKQVSTPLLALCDDDDFVVDAPSVARHAADVFASKPDTLLATPPVTMVFRGDGSAGLQYDRRWMHGLSGLNLLNYIVRTGEVNALVPSVYRTEDVRALEVSDVIRTNEDHVMLARLFARFPRRRIQVLDDGIYMRLQHDNSISSKRNVSVEHLFNQALALTVGACHLIRFGCITRDEFAERLDDRGKLLQRTYGLGRDVFRVFGRFVRDEKPAASTDEAREVLDLLDERARDLPWEFRELAPSFGNGAMRAAPHAIRTVDDRIAPAARPAETSVVEPDVTFMTRFYDRLDHFSLYLHTGLWDGVRMNLICDGSESQFVDELKACVRERGEIVVRAFERNRGIAGARARGFQESDTPFTAVCDDDDFILKPAAYALEAAAVLRSSPDVLLAALPEMVDINSVMQPQHVWDRRSLHGKTALELLETVVRSGRIMGMGTAVFRTEDVRGLEVSDLFRNAEDVVMLARLSHRYPERRVHILNEGAYVRLVHKNGVSQSSTYTPEKIVLAMLAYAVGARYLIEAGRMTFEELLQVFALRGRIFQDGNGAGIETARVVSAFMQGRKSSCGTNESRRAWQFLTEHAEALPREVIALRNDAPVVGAGRPGEPPAYEALIQRSKELHEDGAVVDAVRTLRDALKRQPERVDAYLLLAAIFSQEGDDRQAEKLLRHAASAHPGNAQARYMLGKLLLDAHRHGEAFGHLVAAVAAIEELFAEARDLHAKADEVMRSAILENIEALEATLAEARTDLEVLRLEAQEAPALTERTLETPAGISGRLRIAFVCGPDRKFIQDLVREAADENEVRTIFFDGPFDLNAVQSAMDWADITWFEWCDAQFVQASRRLRKTSKVVCRLHRYEAFTTLPGSVNWDFVDRLVLVADPIRDVLTQIVPDIDRKVRMTTISNGVDLERYPFVNREAGFNLAYVGYIHHRKNPSLLLQCLHALVQKDARYVLHVAGKHQQAEYQLYFEHMLDELGLRSNVKWYGWVDDMSSWLEDKQFLVSASIHESFGYGIAEAMARGIKPLIHTFPGADRIWPAEWLFASVAEFVDRVHNDRYNSGSYRRCISERYSLGRQMRAVKSLFCELAGVHAPAEGHRAPAAGNGNGFIGADRYWEQRYAQGGNSGAGSAGRLARFKAEVVNGLVKEGGVKSVIDFGCGDGEQLSMASYPKYIGLDVSPSAIQMCRERFAEDPTKTFMHYDPARIRTDDLRNRAELALSMDVVFHLTEDDVYDRYMTHLFEAAKRYVVIYANDTDETPAEMGAHVRFRSFSRWIDRYATNWKLVEHIPNRYPSEAGDLSPEDTSFCDFYIYEKQQIGRPAAAPARSVTDVGEGAERARHLIVTGIPRSGTSLLSVLVNRIDDAVCMNEILYDVERLPQQFAEVRNLLMTGAPVPNKYDRSGELTTNTWMDGDIVEHRSVGTFSPDVVIGSKVTAPYLLRLPRLVRLGYPIVALIRDPVYTLGSWNRTQLENSYVAQVTEEQRHHLWKDFDFRGESIIERQAELWQHFASTLWEQREQISIYSYEQLVHDPRAVLTELCPRLGRPVPEDLPELENQNVDSRYERLDEIREAVRRYAPMAATFGYSAPAGDGISSPLAFVEGATKAPPVVAPRSWDEAPASPRRKVFGIGFHKTGTTSLARALEAVGYRMCGPVGVRDPEIAGRALELALQQLDRFEGFQDNPWPLLYREMHARFPDAKFVLTVRPDDEWIDSVVRHFGANDTPMREWIYGVGHPVGNEAVYVDRYRTHNEEVQAYFETYPDQLLVLRITEGEGWERLGPFLDVDPLHATFPHANKGL